MSEKELKEILFEIYSAGFEAGYSQNVDIVSSYNKYWGNFLKGFKKDLKSKSY